MPDAGNLVPLFLAESLVRGGKPGSKEEDVPGPELDALLLRYGLDTCQGDPVGREMVNDDPIALGV